jgi:ATP-dependent RNA helicase SUPV3L1/SUV3
MNVLVPAAHLHPSDRAKSVSVLLGPTNTGKTHYAIERMLSHASGIIGLPLRLLAREVYNRVAEKVGASAVALITGEEKIKPKNPRYWISTVEAMPRDLDVAFVAVDEIQLAADLDRGHIFTDRLLNRRGSEETLLIGASTMERALRELLPGAPIFSRPRLSKLTFAGEKKIARLPRRSAIVAFSAEEVYAIAEWIRRQRGGAAVVLGALSPRTRNAQVEMFQNGDIDYIVATDAIGMGLNLDVDHIAFASDRKFDGWHYRRLIPAEFGQIAGRAGRHMRDGTFGTTGRCPPFDPELVEALEDHRFEPVRMLQWRNTDLDFSSLTALAASLDITPKEPGLTRAPVAEDQLVLEIASRDEKVIRAAKTKADIARLWETCQIPDYRKLSPAAHAELVLSIFHFIVRAGHIPQDWFARHVSVLDRVDGDLDTLSARIAQVRTWTFIANRTDWLDDPEHWQGVTRRVEDILSDALHERLAQRFVDRRTSVLMRRLRENVMLEAEVTSSGDVMVEGQHVGHLNGFRFTADPQAGGEAARTLNAAAQKALASEIEGRATRVHEAVDEAFVLANDGLIRWLGEPVAKLVDGAHILEPRARILSDEQLTGADLEKVQRRLDLWTAQHIKKLLGPLAELEKGEGLEGIARGIAFQVAEALGILERSRVAEDVKGLSQEARAALRKFGVRFGAFHLYLPQLVKPAPRALAAQLWALRHGGVEEMKGLDEVPHLASSGRTSFVADKDVPKGLYRAAGFRVCGDRAVRVDILERLADLVRPAVAYRPGTTPGDPPPGSADGDGFVVTVNMTSLAGCSGESFASILRSLGYQSEQRKGPAITVPLIPKASTEPVHVTEPAAAPEETVATEETPEPSASADETKPEAVEETVAQEAIVEETPVQEISAEPSAEAPVEAQPESQAEIPAEAPAESAVEIAAEAESEPAAAAHEDQTDVAAAEPAAEAEPQLIEVWHPHRQHHQKHAAPRNQRNRPARHAHAAAPGAPAVAATPPETVEAGAAAAPKHEGRDEARRGERHRNDNRRHQPHRENQKQNQEAGAAPATGGGAEQSAKPHFDNRRGKSGPKGPRQDEHRQDRQNKPANAPRPPRERQPDPNSPFAKLLELKARLENNADSK